VPKKFLLLLLGFAVAVDFTGCASLSAQARRERAYRNYVQKQIKQRRKAMARAQKEANRELKRKLKSVQPSEPKITTSVEDVSSEPASFSQPVAAPSESFSEPVAAPVTVSASDAVAAQNPDQPSPP